MKIIIWNEKSNISITGRPWVIVCYLFISSRHQTLFFRNAATQPERGDVENWIQLLGFGPQEHYLKYHGSITTHSQSVQSVYSTLVIRMTIRIHSLYDKRQKGNYLCGAMMILQIYVLWMKWMRGRKK